MRKIQLNEQSQEFKSENKAVVDKQRQSFRGQLASARVIWYPKAIRR